MCSGTGCGVGGLLIDLDMVGLVEPQHISLKSKYKKVPFKIPPPPAWFAEEVKAEPEYRPARLNISALNKGLGKYSRTSSYRKTAEVKKALVKLVERFPDVFNVVVCRPLTHEETIEFLLTKHTSPGYPHRDTYQSTHDFVKDPDNARYLEQMWEDAVNKGVYPESYSLNCLKDEMRKVTKDARQINPFNVEDLYMRYRMFHKHHEAFKKASGRNVSYFGMGGYAGEWSDFASDRIAKHRYMTEEGMNPKYVEDDGKAMDSTTGGDQLYDLYKVRSGFYPVRYRNLVLHLGDVLRQTRIVNHDGQIYLAPNGNPSGQFNTGFDNTLCRIVDMDAVCYRLYNCCAEDAGVYAAYYSDDGGHVVSGHIDYADIARTSEEMFDLKLVWEYKDRIEDLTFLSKRTREFTVEDYPGVTFRGFVHHNPPKMMAQLTHYNGHPVDYVQKLTSFMQMVATDEELYRWISAIYREAVTFWMHEPLFLELISDFPVDRDFCLSLQVSRSAMLARREV